MFGEGSNPNMLVDHECGGCVISWGMHMNFGSSFFFVLVFYFFPFNLGIYRTFCCICHLFFTLSNSAIFTDFFTVPEMLHKL